MKHLFQFYYLFAISIYETTVSVSFFEPSLFYFALKGLGDDTM